MKPMNLEDEAIKIRIKHLKKIEKDSRELAKWLIWLSTGVIVLSVKLVKPSTTLIWRSELILGLGLLMISILVGVHFVRQLVLQTMCSLDIIDNRYLLNWQVNADPNFIHEFRGKKIKASEVKELLNGEIGESEAKKAGLGRTTKILFEYQQWLFYIGIILVTIFGVYNI